MHARYQNPAKRSRQPTRRTDTRPPLSSFFGLWFDRIVPALGRIAGDPQAYDYLPSSVKRFPAAPEPPATSTPTPPPPGQRVVGRREVSHA